MKKVDVKLLPSFLSCDWLEWCCVDWCETQASSFPPFPGLRTGATRLKSMPAPKQPSNRKEPTEEKPHQTLDLAVTLSLFGSIPKCYRVADCTRCEWCTRR